MHFHSLKPAFFVGVVSHILGYVCATYRTYDVRDHDCIAASGGFKIGQHRL